MADYPDGRPANPFPYFTEVMTGFEYTAAIGMLYEGDVENGLRSSPTSGPATTGSSAAPTTRPSAATTTAGP